jgi:hypothetical protein
VMRIRKVYTKWHRQKRTLITRASFTGAFDESWVSGCEDVPKLSSEKKEYHCFCERDDEDERGQDKSWFNVDGCPPDVESKFR